MEEAVEHGDGGGVVGQEAAPLVERPVAGHAQAAALVGGSHEAEEELAAVGVEGRDTGIRVERRRILELEQIGGMVSRTGSPAKAPSTRTNSKERVWGPYGDAFRTVLRGAQTWDLVL